MRLCDGIFTSNTEMDAIFGNWTFELSDFQKWAIKAIYEEHHVLITAHTGSGKTLLAECAIIRAYKLGVKLIYTSPIKALSNQKIREFQDKFPHISFGIITGDTSFNPDADVLIMTTEVLRNTLFQMKNIEENPDMAGKTKLHFKIDIQKELGFVVFDEVHYINDAHRGHVWEETMMMLPQNVQMVMLSATINKPEKFAQWIENQSGKEVWLCPTEKRVVPLEHHTFFTMPESQIKKFDKKTQANIMSIYEKPVTLKKQGSLFNETGYNKTVKILYELNKANVWVNQYFAFNQLIRHLKAADKLPAITFIFSRKRAQIFAEKVEISLFPEDSKIPSIIEKECQQILMKLPNYKEYIALPEYTTIIKLLQKGIAFHHAGMPQVFREMIERLFDKKYIYLLCATETFAVGLNMPTRSVIFPSLSKFDGQKFRLLLPHEYGQQSGRAGRRGIDILGDVWHMANTIHKGNQTICASDYKHIITGPPQTLSSKFQINFSLALKLISINNMDMENFIKKSMISESINAQRQTVEARIVELEIVYNSKTSHTFTDDSVIEKYQALMEKGGLLRGKKKKKNIRELSNLVSEYKHLKQDIRNIDVKVAAKEELNIFKKKLDNINLYVKEEVVILIDILEKEGFIETRKIIEEIKDEIKDEMGTIVGDHNKNNEKIVLTEKGDIANNIQELHSLAMADVLNNRIFDKLDPVEFVSVLSAFAHISIPTDQKVVSISQIEAPDIVIETLKRIESSYNKYKDIELRNKLYFNQEYTLSWDMAELMIQWCNANDDIGAKKVYNNALGYGISLGEFTKCVLKINNIANELEKAALVQGNLPLLEKIKMVSVLTLKSVITNQSLYL
jgi:superfamily II RNA helicase